MIDAKPNSRSDRSLHGSMFDSMPGGEAIASPKWAALGLTLDSTICLSGGVGLSNAGDAGNAKKQFDESIQQMDTMFQTDRSSLPAGFAEIMDQWLDLIHALQVEAAGEMLEIDGRWKVKDIENLLDQFEAFVRKERGSRIGNFPNLRGFGS